MQPLTANSLKINSLLSAALRQNFVFSCIFCLAFGLLLSIEYKLIDRAEG
jgi:hypothetical protein